MRPKLLARDYKDNLLRKCFNIIRDLRTPFSAAHDIFRPAEITFCFAFFAQLVYHQRFIYKFPHIKTASCTLPTLNLFIISWPLSSIYTYLRQISIFNILIQPHINSSSPIISKKKNNNTITIIEHNLTTFFRFI